MSRPKPYNQILNDLDKTSFSKDTPCRAISFNLPVSLSLLIEPKDKKIRNKGTIYCSMMEGLSLPNLEIAIDCDASE